MSLFKNLVEKFPFFAQNFREIRDQLDRNQPALRTPWDFLLSGNKDMASGNFEPIETQLIRSMLPSYDLFINIGANIGYYCCHAASLGLQVIAIEPNQRNLHYLMRNVSENGWKERVEIFPIALSEKVDILEMWGGQGGASLIKGWASTPESYKRLVPVSTLDRVLYDKIENKRVLIVVDIEGGEFKMLKGANKVLENKVKPTWIIEIQSTDHQPNGLLFNPNYEKTFQLFHEKGYVPSYCLPDTFELKSSELKEIISGVRTALTHNYIFA